MVNLTVKFKKLSQEFELLAQFNKIDDLRELKIYLRKIDLLGKEDQNNSMKIK